MTAAVAAGVTALIAGPMLAMALGAGPADRVDADGITISTPGEGAADSRELDGATVAAVGSASITIDIEARAVAWVLAPAGAAAIDEGTDRSAPFVIEPDPALIGDGRYELLVTAVDGDGEVIRRAARFEVGGESTEAAP
ncbi:MAG: hypothetical protein ACE367_12930 [Acidimicrobiales bacterium]